MSSPAHDRVARGTGRPSVARHSILERRRRLGCEVCFGSRLCENAGSYCWGATIEPKDAASEITSCALGERFESIVRPDDPQNRFHTASVKPGNALIEHAIPLNPSKPTSARL